MTPMERIEGELSDAQKRIAELEYLLARQAKAAQQGMDAAKAVASSELEQAKRLHAECNPRALESERAANTALTERVAELEDREAALAAHVDAAKELVESNRMKGMMSTSRPVFSRSMWEWYQESPTTSLARRDLIKQAEAMERLADRKQRESEAEEDFSLRRKQAYAAVCAANECGRLRRQAEALNEPPA